MKILATVELYARQITSSFRVVSSDGAPFLLQPIGDDKFLAIRLYPDRIVPPAEGSHAIATYKGPIGPADHEAEIKEIGDITT